MNDIGATLREARMHARVDISEVEAATKIRAKYLRALENEEWTLLPGSTFTKSFLRTYAEYLGLDGRLLVEQYKQRYEGLADHELRPIVPLGAEQRRSPARVISPGIVVGAIVVALLVLLFLIGSLGGSGSSTTPSPPTTAAQRLAQERAARRAHELAVARARRERLAQERLTLQIVPSGSVYVCLVDDHGHALVPGRILSAGSAPLSFTGHGFRISLGNDQVTLRVDGALVRPPTTGNAIAYALRAGSKAQLIPPSQGPTCR